MSEWISASNAIPEVPKGDDRDFIVCVRRAHNGKSYVFPASYLNRKALYSEDDDADEDGMVYVTGWLREMADDEYDTAWHSILGDGDVVTHWQPLPPPPEQDK